MNDDDRGDIHPSTFRPQEPGNPTQLEIDAALFRSRRLGILLNKTRTPDGPGAPGCWLGGAPTLPEDIEWPWFTWPRCGGFKTPMRFLAQINMCYLPRLADRADMPETGTLFFFFDPYGERFWSHPDHFRWGETKKHKSMIPCRVIHIDDDVSGCPPRSMPEVPDFPDFPFEGEPSLPLERILPHAHEKLPGTQSFKEQSSGMPKGICEDIDGAAVYWKWAFDFLVYENFANPDHRGIVGSQSTMKAIIAVRERLGQLMEDRYVGVNRDQCPPEYRARNHMFNDIGWNQESYFTPNSVFEHLFDLHDLAPDERPVRLLAIYDDEEENGFYFGSWVVFYIREADLKAGRFDKAFVVWEDF